MSTGQPTALEQLDNVIAETVSHISDFTVSPTAFTRNRKLNAGTTLKVILGMQGKGLNKELLDAFPNSDDRMTASALEQAKAKFKPDVTEHIFREFNNTLTEPKLLDDKYRVFAIDGSDFNPNYSPDSAYVMDAPSGRPRKDGEPVKPYCQIHTNILYDIENRYYHDCILQSRSHMDERGAAIEMIKRIDNSVPFIVEMDRGYESLNLFCNCDAIDNCYYIVRVKDGKCGIKEIQALPDKEIDTEIEFTITTSGTFFRQWKDKIPNLKYINHIHKHYKEEISKNTTDRRWDFGKFHKLKVRVCKFRINDADTGREEWEVLVTNLNRFEFSIDRLKEQYFSRWKIEESFRSLKYAVGGIQFHSKKDNFVQMEFFANLTMYNVTSRNINTVSVPKGIEKKYKYEVNFKDAVAVTKKYFRLFNIEPYEKVYTELLMYTHPVREGRRDKRKIKPKTAVWFVYRVA